MTPTLILKYAYENTLFGNHFVDVLEFLLRSQSFSKKAFFWDRSTKLGQKYKLDLIQKKLCLVNATFLGSDRSLLKKIENYLFEFV